MLPASLKLDGIECHVMINKVILSSRIILVEQSSKYLIFPCFYLLQVLFDKKLSMLQWVSLILLTFGCIVKQVRYENFSSLGSSLSMQFDLHLFLILLQVFSSCFAGVYNEYLLKGKSGDVPLMIQNCFMYLDSVLCNFAILWVNGSLAGAFTKASFLSIAQIKVMAIIVNNAAIGITTSLFLKQLNSILKTFASALEIMFTAVLCWIIFGIPVDIFTFLAIAIVSYAVLLYAQNPVDNTPKPLTTETEKDILKHNARV